MNWLERIIATFFIWAALAGIMIESAILASDPIIALFLVIGASVSSTAVWVSAAIQANAKNQQTQAERSEKGKREHSRLARLMDSLDERELEDLEALLAARREGRLADDGEQIALEDVLTPRRRR